MPKKQRMSFDPSPEQQALLPDVSGNSLNGVGEKSVRRPTPVYWHKPDTIPHGPAQAWMTEKFNAVPDFRTIYATPDARGPRKLDAVADEQAEDLAENWSQWVKSVVLENEGDLVGITALRTEWVFEGFDLSKELPWLVVIGIAMDFDEFSAAPSSDTDTRSALEVADKYNQGARCAAHLSNWIRGHGFNAKPHAGPWAGSITLSPAAIEAGLGELGDHGNLINDQYGSCFRLAAVSTDLPLVSDRPKEFGVDDYCMRCEACNNACPAGAISTEKQWVRGVEKYYVDFDKCLPYFNETHGCGICLGVCPWSRPGVADKLVTKLAKQRQQND
ncbi:MAG: 4Fe-4S dicluster domain-containing protein [Woeseiaceae bacterium]|nr:4Fe-4S dicluster domain-containing protein [Woeseiaceae bacterium]